MNNQVEMVHLNEFANEGNIHSLTDLWNRNVKDIFPISNELFERNLINNHWVVNDNSYIAMVDREAVGMIITKSSSKDSSVNNDPKIWISAFIVDSGWRRKGVGSMLLKRVEENVSKEEIVFGTDPYHLFPGIPDECKEGIEFFEAHGYEISGKAYDLRTDISNYKKIYSLSEEYSVERLSEDHHENLLELIKTNFSQRWYNDTKTNLLKKDRKIDGTFGLFDQEKIIGFAHVSTYHDDYISPSVYWKGLLKAQYAGLGPIGVDKDYRGKGLGTSFFEEIIHILQKEGIQDMTVDWTILLNFYGKFGFKPWKTYLHAKDSSHVANLSRNGSPD